MLLGPLKIMVVSITTLSGILGIIYLSKPDKGGLERCQMIFGLDSLDQRGLEFSPLFYWNPFENPKFRMKIENGKFDDLKLYLFDRGYTQWKDGGGLEYGSLYIDYSTAAVEYSFRKFQGRVHLIAYDKSKNFVYAIVSQ